MNNNQFFAALFLMMGLVLASCSSVISSADRVYEFEQEAQPTLRVQGMLLSDGYFLPTPESRKRMETINAEHGISSLSIRGFAKPEYFKFRENYLPTRRAFVFTAPLEQLMSVRDDEVIPVFVDMDIALCPALVDKTHGASTDASVPIFPGWMERGAAWLCTDLRAILACDDQELELLNSRYLAQLEGAYQRGNVMRADYLKIKSQIEKPLEPQERGMPLWSDMRFPIDYARYLKAKGNSSGMDLINKLLERFPEKRERILNESETPYARF